MSRKARPAPRGSSGSSPSSSGGSPGNQHSQQSHQSNRSHASRDTSRHGSQHGSRHSHRSRHRSIQRRRSLGLTQPCTMRKFKRRGQISIKLWIQQMEYYFSITRIPERKHVMGMINQFDSVHFPEVQHYKTCSYPEFRKKLFSIFKTPDLTDVNIKELMSAQQKPCEPVLAYLSPVQDNVAKSCPKLTEGEPAGTGNYDVFSRPTRSGSGQNDSHPGEWLWGVGPTHC